ncbi:MAG TPA: A24 family peptidase [Polyangiaceae bacterium]|nr:A24 family peptidase [Polyangiaceae bacterium]
MSATQIVLGGLLLFTALAGFVDFRTGQIPNPLVAIGAGVGLVLHFIVHLALIRQSGQPLFELLSAAAVNVFVGLLGCAAVPLLLYRVGAMGGGDVKLLASVGIWAGPILGLQVELYAFVLAALYAPARLAYQGELFRLIGNSAALLKNPFLPKTRRKEVPQALLTELRFGPAVFVATALVALVRWRNG